jgi:uncharacterized protein YdaL
MRTLLPRERAKGASLWAVGSALVALAALALGSPVACRGEAAAVRVLIVHEPEEDGDASAQWTERQLRNLLGHFECRITSRSSASYAAGEAGRHDVTFYLSTHLGGKAPEELLRDLGRTRTRVCWLGYNAWELTRRPGEARRLGFRALLPEPGASFPRVTYKGQTLSRPEVALSRIEITDPKLCQVLARAEGEEGSLPYLVRSGEFWLFGDLPFTFASEADRYLVLCDVLHDILGQDREEGGRRALLRLEDISPDTDPGELSAAVEYLASEKVPFSISLIPCFRDPAAGREIWLSQRPELVAALRGATAKGGCVVLHGLSHQVRGRTAKDAEFWDLAGRGPLRGKGPGWARARVERGVEECLRCGLYPIAWETPHYLASARDYREIGEVFSTAYERRLVAEDARSGQIFPYLIHRDLYGQQVIPENLGHVRGEPAQVEPLLEGARALSVVRDGIASGYFHLQFDLDWLRLLVMGLRGAGYHFEDLRRFPHEVRGRSATLVSVARPAPLGGLVAEDKEAWVVDGKGRIARRLGSKGRQAWESKLAGAGEILVIFPRGRPPQQLLIARASLRSLSWGAVGSLVKVILVLSSAACGVLVILFGWEAWSRRRAYR